MTAGQPTPPAWTTRPGELLLHPAALTALVVLLANDHLLKAQWPGLVTGKLSDVAGLVLLPLFLHALWIGAVRTLGRVPSENSARVALLAACLLTALAFAAIKLTTLAHEAYRTFFGALQWPWQAAVNAWIGQELPPIRPVALVMDPWDLLAILALVVPNLLLPRTWDIVAAWRGRSSVLVAFALGALAVTSCHSARCAVSAIGRRCGGLSVHRRQGRAALHADRRT